jgi:hypothetical protein
MAQDATDELPNIASRENILEQLGGSAGDAKARDGSFLSRVTGNPLFTAVSVALPKFEFEHHLQFNNRASVLPYLQQAYDLGSKA